ncbi:MAG: hypothetical protein M1818_003139 [Claussenomyces sp. TS43310]|nr:MAG: hypothetical protein M1818_003139 [Claussenomyces sp. TS43310]
MAGSRPVTPASPKNIKVRPQEPGVPLYGCEHLQRLLTKSPEVTTNTIQHYKMLLRVIFDNTPIIPQTSRSNDRPPVTSLTPNYLCLQCPSTITERERTKHGKLKAHMMYVDSRSGGLFCQMCGDFVWDPTLEDLRVRKIGTGSFSTRKRKLDGLFSDSIKDDTKYLSSNTTAAPCRANGLRGIYNMGATCFMSVILQSLIHNPLLRNYYLSDGHQSGACLSENCLSCAMDELYQDFYAQDATLGYSASKILFSSWHAQQAAFPHLAGNDEQDAQEFFQFLVEELHRNAHASRIELRNHDVVRPQSRMGNVCDCIVHQTFYGKLQSTLTCQRCQGVTTAVEPFLDLSLGLEDIGKKKSGKGAKPGPRKSQTLTLQRLLDDYQRPERCEYTCHRCDSPQEAKKQLSIKRLPNVLCIQLKRFKHDQLANTTFKLDTKVQFPLQLNMLPYTSRARMQDIRESFELSRSCTYDLLSVVVHSGGKLHTGELALVIPLPGLMLIDQDTIYRIHELGTRSWFMFNDHKVSLASESQVLGAEAFILFYIVRSLA